MDSLMTSMQAEADYRHAGSRGTTAAGHAHHNRHATPRDHGRRWHLLRRARDAPERAEPTGQSTLSVPTARMDDVGRPRVPLVGRGAERGVLLDLLDDAQGGPLRRRRALRRRRGRQDATARRCRSTPPTSAACAPWSGTASTSATPVCRTCRSPRSSAAADDRPIGRCRPRDRAGCCRPAGYRARERPEDRVDRGALFDGVLYALTTAVDQRAAAGGRRGRALGRPRHPRPARLPAHPAGVAAARDRRVLPQRRPAPPASAAPGGRRVGPPAPRPPRSTSLRWRRPRSASCWIALAVHRPRLRRGDRPDRRPRRGQRLLRRGVARRGRAERQRRQRPGRAGRPAAGPARPALRRGPPGRSGVGCGRSAGAARAAGHGCRPARRSSSTPRCARPSTRTSSSRPGTAATSSGMRCSAKRCTTTCCRASESGCTRRTRRPCARTPPSVRRPSWPGTRGSRTTWPPRTGRRVRAGEEAMALAAPQEAMRSYEAALQLHAVVGEPARSRRAARGHDRGDRRGRTPFPGRRAGPEGARGSAAGTDPDRPGPNAGRPGPGRARHRRRPSGLRGDDRRRCGWCRPIHRPACGPRSPRCTRGRALPPVDGTNPSAGPKRRCGSRPGSASRRRSPMLRSPSRSSKRVAGDQEAASQLFLASIEASRAAGDVLGEMRAGTTWPVSPTRTVDWSKPPSSTDPPGDERASSAANGRRTASTRASLHGAGPVPERRLGRERARSATTPTRRRRPAPPSMLRAVGALVRAGRGDASALADVQDLRSDWAARRHAGRDCDGALAELQTQAGDTEGALATYRLRSTR